MAKRRRVLVIGAGRFGAAIVNELWDAGSEVVVVDRDPATIDQIKDRAHGAFVADATDPAVLESLGPREFEVALVAFGGAFESAVLCVASLKQLGVSQIIARAETARRASVLRAVGATRVHELETEMGHRVALEIIAPIATDLLEFAHEYRVVPWDAAGSLVGKTLATSGLFSRYGIYVIGIRPRARRNSGGKPKLEPPRPDYAIGEGDTLLLVGAEEGIERFVAEGGG